MPAAATRLRLLLAAATWAITAAAPSQAAFFTQVYTGTVTFGFDYAGLFNAGPDLTGLAYTATYLIDDSKGLRNRSISEIDNKTYVIDQFYGGPGFGNGTVSPISAKLTINGNTIFVAGNISAYSTERELTKTRSYDNIESYTSDYINGSNIYLSNYIRSYDFFTSAAVGAPRDLVSPESGTGYFQASDVGGTYTYANFSVARLVSGPAAVPEPASWALMIGGFGLIGGAMRRRPQPISLAA